MKTIDIYDKDGAELRDEVIFADKSASKIVRVPRSSELARDRDTAQQQMESYKKEAEQGQSSKRAR